MERLSQDYLRSSSILGDIEKIKDGNAVASVAIIGAGLSGLVAGNELLKKGFKPVIYEKSQRVGGRVFTRHFDKDPKALAEVGAMRVPQDHELVLHYLNKYNITLVSFPDMLMTDTCVYFEGKEFWFDKYEGWICSGGGPKADPEKLKVLAEKLRAIQ